MFHGNELNEDGIYSVGISSGAVALSANYMGYKTGFCRCFKGKEVTALMEKTINKDLISINKTSYRYLNLLKYIKN